MKYYVYALRNKYGLLYRGVTSNLAQRLDCHNRGLSNWTRNKGPFEVVYFEVFNSKKEALKRERFFKSGHGREFLKQKVEDNSGM